MEQEERRRSLATYTTVLRLTPGMKDFLHEFYRQVYTPAKQQYYMTERLTFPEVDAYYRSLVEEPTPPLVSMEDFWQRYEYRCVNLHRIALDMWQLDRTDRTTSASSTSPSASSLLLCEALSWSSLQDDEDDDHHHHTASTTTQPHAPSLVPVSSWTSSSSSPRNGSTAIKTLQQILDDARQHGEATRAETEAFQRQRRRAQDEEEQEHQDDDAFLAAAKTTKGDKWKRRLANKRTTRHSENKEGAAGVAATTTAIFEPKTRHENVPVLSQAGSKTPPRGKDSEKVQKWKHRLANKRAVRENSFKELEDIPFVDDATETTWQLQETLTIADPFTSLSKEGMHDKLDFFTRDSTERTEGLNTFTETSADPFVIASSSSQPVSKGATLGHLPAIKEDDREDSTLIPRYAAVDWGNHLYDTVEEAQQSLTQQKEMYGKALLERLDDVNAVTSTQTKQQEQASTATKDHDDLVSMARTLTITKGVGTLSHQVNKRGWGSFAVIPGFRREATHDKTSTAAPLDDCDEKRHIKDESSKSTLTTGLVDGDDATRDGSNGEGSSFHSATMNESSEILDTLVAYFNADQSFVIDATPTDAEDQELDNTASWNLSVEELPPQHSQDNILHHVVVAVPPARHTTVNSSAYLDDNTGTPEEKCECQSPCSIM